MGTGCHGGWAVEKLFTPVVLMESLTYGKCLNLPAPLLCLCDAITGTLEYVQPCALGFVP